MQSAEQIVAGGVDLLTPFEVEVDFQPIERSPPTFSDGNPVNLIDYRTIPIMIIGGNTTASVSVNVLSCVFFWSRVRYHTIYHSVDVSGTVCS